MFLLNTKTNHQQTNRLLQVLCTCRKHFTSESQCFAAFVLMKGYAPNISFETLYSDPFTSSTWLMILNYLFYTLPLTQHHSSFSTCNLCHLNLRICSCLACIYRVIDAHRKFGELEKCVRVAWITAESNSSFWELSKLPKCIHNSIYTQLKAWANSFITERQQGSACRSLNCDRVQNSHNAQKKEINAPNGWSKTQHILYFGLSENIWSS